MADRRRSVTEVYQDANNAYNKGKWQDAIDGWYRVLATGKAKQPEAFHFNCASAYTNMQQFDKAIEEYNTCIKLSPGHQQALLRRSAILHKTHKFEEALSGYNELLASGLHSQNIFVQKLNVLNILDRFENTMEIVESALKLTKDEGAGPISENLSFNAEVAFALCKLKNVDAAYAEELLPYAKFLERMNKEGKLNGPQHRYHRIYLASLSRIAEYYAEHDFDTSYEFFSKLIDEEPTNASTYFNRGVICRRTRLGTSQQEQKDRLEKAVENFSKAIELESDPAYYKGLGNAKLMQKDYVGALDALNKASQKDIKVLYNIGVCQLNLRKVQDAYNAMENVLKMDPGYEPALNAHQLLGPIIKKKRLLFKELADRLRLCATDTPEFKAALEEARKAQNDSGFLQEQKDQLVQLASAKGATISTSGPADESATGSPSKPVTESAAPAAAASSTAVMPPVPVETEDATKGATCDFEVEDKQEQTLPEIKTATTKQEEIEQGQLFKVQVPKGVSGGQRILMDMGANSKASGSHITSVVVPKGMKEDETFMYNPDTGITVDKNNVITRQRVVQVDKDKNGIMEWQRLPMAVGFLLSQSAHPYIQKYKELLKKRDEDLDPVELEIKRAIQAIGRGKDDLADAVTLGHTQVVLTLEEILGEGGRKPKDFDIYNKERYLSDADFLKLFKMDRASFKKLKRWRQNKLKKKYGLF